MSVKVTFNFPETIKRIQMAEKKALFATSVQALKDSNLYCPEDQRTLKKSSEIKSKLDEGLLIWDTPYSKKMYYHGGDFTKQKAHKMWAHYAKSRHGNEWLDVFENTFNEEMNR